MSIASVTNFEISPLNQASGNNATFSYRNGNPIITLRIPSTQMYLLTSTCRLNFVLTAYQPNGNLPTNSTTPAAPVGQVLISDRIGNNSVFDSISVATSTNSSIEQCRNYGRLLASSIPATSGFNEYSTHLSQWFGGTCSSNMDVAAKCLNRSVQCSAPLLTGVLGSGQAIPLGDQNGVGGMIITIQLNSNNQALFSSLPAMAGAYYEISGVTMTGKYGVPVGGKLPPIKNIRFSAYQSYYDVVNNNDATLSIDSKLGAVTSVFSNYLPTTSIQNFSQDSFQTPALANAVAGDYTNPAPVRTINFMKAGQKFPLQFQIDETSLRQSTTAPAGVFGAKLNSFDALRQYYFQDAVRLTRNDIDALAGARSEGTLSLFNNFMNDSPSEAPPRVITFNSAPSLGRCFGIGVRFDSAGIGATTSFKNAPYSLRLTSELDGISPYSMYSFFLYQTVLTLGQNGQVTISS